MKAKIHRRCKCGEVNKMLKFQLDTVTKQGKEFIAYVHIMDGEKLIHATSLVFKDKKDFKKNLKGKTAKIKADYDEKEGKKKEIELALKEM